MTIWEERTLPLMWHQLSSELFKKLHFFSLNAVMGHHFNTSKYFWWWEQTSFYSIHTLLFLLNPAWSCFLFLSVRSHSAAPGVHVLCLSLSLCFSLSFFSLVDLLLWLWPDDASFQHLMGWESTSFLCLWDHDVISYFGFFHHPDASVDVERMRAALSRCSQGSWKTIHGLFARGMLLLCLGGSSEKGHGNTAPVSQRVVGLLGGGTAYSGFELGRWKIFLPAVHSPSSLFQLLNEAQYPSDLVQGKCCFVRAVPQSYLCSWRLKKITVIRFLDSQYHIWCSRSYW